MMVSGKKQDGSKQNNGWLCSTDFQREKSKYRTESQINDKTKTKITTWLIFLSPYCSLIKKGIIWN